MNSKTALTVIVMFAVIMGLGISPAMAAPNDPANDKAKVGKVKICHWQEQVLLLDENGNPVLDENGNPIVLEEAQWIVINVSKNAVKAHVGVHTDGVTFDQEITDEFTVDDCLALNEATEV